MDLCKKKQSNQGLTREERDVLAKKEGSRRAIVQMGRLDRGVKIPSSSPIPLGPGYISFSTSLLVHLRPPPRPGRRGRGAIHLHHPLHNTTSYHHIRHQRLEPSSHCRHQHQAPLSSLLPRSCSSSLSTSPAAAPSSTQPAAAPSYAPLLLFLHPSYCSSFSNLCFLFLNPATASFLFRPCFFFPSTSCCYYSLSPSPCCCSESPSPAAALPSPNCCSTSLNLLLLLPSCPRLLLLSSSLNPNYCRFSSLFTSCKIL
ncbi:hypothetical protein VPH35_124686 [Triticum aestivum]